MTADLRHLSIRVIMLPKDTNGRGTIFGGVILSQLDLAGGEAAFDYKPHRYVTVCMKEVVFHEPVYVGDLVSYYTRIVKIGRTSITVKVDVEARRAILPGETVKVTEAEVVFVAVGKDGKPIPIDSDPSGLVGSFGRA